MTRLEELTLMIRRGWGDIPQKRIPDDWRETWGPGQHHAETMREYRARMRAGVQLRDTEKWKARRAEYLTEACPFSLGSQFRFPFSFSETG
jgi:hypothetical protein